MIIVHTGISVVLTRKYRYKYRDIFEMTQSEVIAAMEADAVKENTESTIMKIQERTGSWE